MHDVEKKYIWCLRCEFVLNAIVNCWQSFLLWRIEFGSGCIKYPCKLLIHHVVFLWSLTHWGQKTYICVGKLTIIASDNGLSPGRHQAIIWTNAGILFIGPLGTNFSEIVIEIHTFSVKKIYLKMPSAKRQSSWYIYGKHAVSDPLAINHQNASRMKWTTIILPHNSPVIISRQMKCWQLCHKMTFFIGIKALHYKLPIESWLNNHISSNISVKLYLHRLVQPSKQRALQSWLLELKTLNETKYLSGVRSTRESHWCIS